MGRLEARACGDMAMFFEEQDVAEAWAGRCRKKDFRLPDLGVDGSYNYAPCLLAGTRRWDELRDVLQTYWERGAGNEFNSPLYAARVLTAACLMALHGSTFAHKFVRRWVGFLALQAVVVRNQPKIEWFYWAGAKARLRHLTRSGIAIPPTGLRVNGASLGDPLHAVVLAHLLGVEQTYHRRVKAWERWIENPPTDYASWAGVGNPPSPQVLVETIRGAEQRKAMRFQDFPWMKFCREVVEGDMNKWSELLEVISVPLPRGIKRFVIQRSPSRVMTWWEGLSPTRQKPSCASAEVEERSGKRSRTQLVMPAPWEIPSLQTRCRAGDRIVAFTKKRTQAMAKFEGESAAVFGA